MSDENDNADVLANARYYTDRLLDETPSNEAQDNAGPRIRLLFLEPGNYGDLIQGQLRTVEVHDSIPYKALSYSWGHTASTTVIRLDAGFLFRVRRNLEDALQRIRHPTRTTCIWIDAVCINQADHDERSAQVSQMGEIYSRAAQVLVWLGETRTHSDMGQAMYTSAVNLAQQQENIWWRRLWVVQETIAARQHPSILFGPFALEWDVFMLQWQELYDQARLFLAGPVDDEHELEVKFLHGGLVALKTLERLWAINTEHRQLYQILIQTREYLCADDHDRIYALLHLLPLFERSMFSPDYDTPFAEPFATATAHCIRTSPAGFDILLHYWQRGDDDGRPTWWLDFTKPFRDGEEQFFCRPRISDKFRSPELEVELSGDLPTLRASGVCLEEVAMIKPFRALFESFTGSFSMLKWLSFLQDIMFAETQDQIHYFTSKPRLTLRYRRPSRLASLRSEVRGLRLGMIKSFIWIYRNHAQHLSDTMKQVLDDLESMSDDVFKLKADEWNSNVGKMADRVDPILTRLMERLMNGLYPLLALYDIFITTHGFVGLCKRKNQDDESSKRSKHDGDIQLGDQVVIFRGGTTPFVIRLQKRNVAAPESNTLPDASASATSTSDSLSISTASTATTNSKASSRWSLSRWSSRSSQTETLSEDRFTLLDGCCVPAIMNGQLQSLTDGDWNIRQSFAFT